MFFALHIAFGSRGLEAHVSLVDKRSRLQRVVRGFLSQTCGGNSAELFVNQRNKPLLRRTVSRFQLEQKLRDIVRIALQGNPRHGEISGNPLYVT